MEIQVHILVQYLQILHLFHHWIKLSQDMECIFYVVS
jgi:hypothetical protein